VAALPIPSRKSGVLHFHGQDIPMRSLTARELTGLREVADPHAVNVALIAASFDMTLTEAEAWYDAVDASDVLEVLEAINRVSGIGEAAQFPGTAGDAAVDAQPAE
jgi:hypothetical protein